MINLSTILYKSYDISHNKEKFPYSKVSNKAAHPVICEDCHVIHM